MLVVQHNTQNINLPEKYRSLLVESVDNLFCFDTTLQDYDFVRFLNSTNLVTNMSSDILTYLSYYEDQSPNYISVPKFDSLFSLCKFLISLLTSDTKVICFSWQIPRNYILDSVVTILLENGFTVICSGGNSDLPVLDLSPVAVDGVIRVGGSFHKGHYANWLDCYDYIVEGMNDSNLAAHYISDQLATGNRINVDYRLDFYSENFVRSAPWAMRLCTEKLQLTKYYEFIPVSNLRYLAGEQLLPVKKGDTVSILSGSTSLTEFSKYQDISCSNELPRGINFDLEHGWLYGTFKYKENMFHRIQADLNGQYFEFHIISCDADNKLSYNECKKLYYTQEYSAPPFSIREYWMPMSKPVKLLEPGDPWIRTYNLNDNHLYRSYK